MSRGLVVSVTLVSLLFGSLLNADSVALKELKTLSNPKMTFGDAGAKAKAQEAQNKLMFEAKMDESKFREEALEDESKQLKYSISKEASIEKKSFKQSPKEIIDAFNNTINALKAIDQNDLKSAKKNLADATDIFNKVLKANPDLKLVPLVKEMEVREFVADAKFIKESIKTAKKLLESDDTQAARAILLPLEDEIIITTEYIPMDIYPVATKNAKDALDKNDELQAMAILSSALSAIVVDRVVLPISLLKSSNLVIAASQIDKKDKKTAIALLDKAQDELQKAVLLGYTKKHSPEYKALIEDIKAIKKEINGKNIVEKLYDKLKVSFENLLGKTRKDIQRSKAENKVNSFEKEESQKAHKETKDFQKASKEDMKKTLK